MLKTSIVIAINKKNESATTTCSNTMFNGKAAIPPMNTIDIAPIKKPILQTTSFSSKNEFKKYKQNSIAEMKKPVLNSNAVGPIPSALIG